MAITREHVHKLVDTIDFEKLETLYWQMLDFAQEEEMLAGELEAIENGRRQIENGETFRHDEIDWNNLDKMDLD